MIDMNVENNRVREELEKDMKYLLEQKSELERQVRIGKEAERKLGNTTKELESVLTAWLGSKAGNGTSKHKGILLVCRRED
mgnify:CR=1 FL=1